MTIDPAHLEAFLAPQWEITKPVVAGAGGVVAAQNRRAAEIGADVLAAGGNAVDAAIATSFALAALEPWMSGPGGGGVMVVHQAASGQSRVVDFAMRAPAKLDPADYPLSGSEADDDLFGWPTVVEDHNLQGPHSVCVPGQVAGMALAADTFASLSWADLIAPAIALAEAGLAIDWHAMVRIAGAAPVLAEFPSSAAIYLPGGLPPVPPAGQLAGRIPMGALAKTLTRLASAGAADFYTGEVAHALVADLIDAGSSMTIEDLAAYRARLLEPLEIPYRDTVVHTVPGLSAGPTLARALELLNTGLNPGATPDADAYRAYAAALTTAYRERLQTMGDHEDPRAPGCTTHIGVVDRAGNVVALTQTLLSVFGSKFVAPATGVLMNNAVMWFDPRPEQPNSIRPGRLPLTNMCPSVLTRDGRGYAALGASGGRKITPAVAQIASFMIDFGMDLGAALHQPRLDASGPDLVLADPRLDAATRAMLAEEFGASEVAHVVWPPMYASPNAVAVDPAGGGRGIADVMSPWAGVAGAG